MKACIYKTKSVVVRVQCVHLVGQEEPVEWYHR